MKRIIILGAGISGLSAAWYLKQRFKDSIDLTILEKNSQVGGWIQTIQEKGFLFETGPHSFRATGGEVTLQLIEQLNLQNEIISAHPDSRRRYLYTDKQLKPLPYSFFSGLISPFTYKLILAAGRDLLTPPGTQEDESIQSFAYRRFGKSITEEFIDPLISGIYAGDIAALSLKSCFPKWHQWEQKYHSLIKGAFKKKKQEIELPPWMQPIKQAGIYTLRDGMQRLPQALGKELESHTSLECSAENITIHENKIEITTSKGDILQTDFLVSTVHPKVLSALLKKNHSHSSKLINIPSASVAVVCLGYKKSLLQRTGFGYLVPSKEKEAILGIIWDSSVFPEQNNHSTETRLTVMLGGVHHPEIAFLSKEEIYQIAIKALQKHLGIKEIPDAVHIKIAIDAIPQYNVGYFQEVQMLKENLRKLSPRFICLGNAFHGVSLNDCIINSKLMANDLLTMPE